MKKEWSIGVMEYWNNNKLEYWSIGVLEKTQIPSPFLFKIHYSITALLQRFLPPVLNLP